VLYVEFRKTALQSIQAHVGRKMKAKRFADDAQDFCNLLSAATGAALTLFVTTTRCPDGSARAPRRRTLSPLNLFGDGCSNGSAATTRET